MEKPWGGDYYKKNINKNASKKTGEIFIVSALKNQESLIIYEDKKIPFNTFYKNKYDLFFLHKEKKEFPILIKILTVFQNTSVQIHPDDNYALKHEKELGKNESWFILDLINNDQIILGHNAKNNDEFKKLVNNHEWNKLVRKININIGSLIDTIPWTVHAICGGTILYEIQESSPITYRMYDYNRVPKRELHIKKIFDGIYSPQNNIFPINYKKTKNQETIILENEYYKLNKIDVDDDKKLVIYANDTCKLITVVKGSIYCNGEFYGLYDTFILTTNSESYISGCGELLIGIPK